MNAIAFSVLAVAIVVLALGVVGLPRLRETGGALALLLVVVAILAAATGQYFVTIALLLTASGGVLLGRAVIPLGRRGDRPRGEPVLPRRWWVGAAVGAGLGALVVVVLALSGGDFVSGTSAPGAASALGAGEPYALVIAVVLAAIGIGAGLLLGRTSHDEQEHEARAEARRARDERMRARREARDAAKRARREASTAGGGR